MNRHLLSCGAVAIALSVATGIAVNACSNPDLVETPGEKSEWAILQSIEYQERDRPLQEPTFRLVGKAEVLGLRDMNGKNTWLLLRVQSPPFYKQMPAVNYEVPQALIDQLVKERRASYTVVQVLRSHVRVQ